MHDFLGFYAWLFGAAVVFGVGMTVGSMLVLAVVP